MSAQDLTHADRLGENSCCHPDMSPYRVDGDRIYFSFRFLRMYIGDLLDDHDVPVRFAAANSKKPYLTFNPITGRLKDKSGIDASLTLSDLYREQVQTFHFERWYGQIPSAATFPSLIIPLTDKHVQQLLRGDPRGCVALRIEAAIESGRTTVPPPYFVRLNSVSPKDASLEPVETPSEIICRLLESKRTRTTLEERDFSASVVLREYVPDMKKEHEFRCFIRKNRLTAISQYHWDLHFEQLEDQELRRDLVDRVSRFARLLQPHLPYEDCVMDVVYLPSRKDGSLEGLGIYVIEFNSFGGEMPCGAALFNWKRDRSVLYGEAEMEVRFAQRPLLGPNGIDTP